MNALEMSRNVLEKSKEKILTSRGMMGSDFGESLLVEIQECLDAIEEELTP